MIELTCPYEPEHVHVFPDDWNFGGASGTDPRADPRWKPTSYTYIDDRVRLIHTTQAPICDDQAIDEFTKVAGWGKNFNPVWLQVRRGDVVEMLPWTYDKLTDEVSPI